MLPHDLRHLAQRFLPEELDLYFDDVVDAAERIWDLLDNYKEVVEALEETNESVIAHQQGDVLRILTVIATIALATPGLPEGTLRTANWLLATGDGQLLDAEPVALLAPRRFGKGGRLG